MCHVQALHPEGQTIAVGTKKGRLNTYAIPLAVTHNLWKTGDIETAAVTLECQVASCLMNGTLQRVYFLRVEGQELYRVANMLQYDVKTYNRGRPSRYRQNYSSPKDLKNTFGSSFFGKSHFSALRPCFAGRRHHWIPTRRS